MANEALRKSRAATDRNRHEPNPGRETRLLIDSFVDALTRDEPDGSGLAARIRQRHQKLVSSHEGQPPDELAWMHLKTALILVAARRELRGRYPDEVLMARMTEALIEPLRSYVADATLAALDSAADPFAAMVAITRARERDFFGPSFHFEHPVDDDQGYVAEVCRCYYHDVLAAYGEAELTPILCAFDATWIEVIDPARHGFRFNRPTTIASGGPSCPFSFARTGAPEGDERASRTSGRAWRGGAGKRPISGCLDR